MTSATSPLKPAAVRTTEGEMLWEIKNTGKECKTWYRIYGGLKSGIRPLLVVHGGPGVTSDYLVSLSDLTVEEAIPVVIYDQVGNGLSTHFPEMMGDVSFWTEELFLDELNRLLDHLGIIGDYDLFGHSWGGMLGARHASRRPRGLKRLILMSTPASGALWIEAQTKLRKTLPEVVQETFERCEREGKTSSKEYQEVSMLYYSQYLCTINPMPESLQKSFEWMGKDPTVYLTLNGSPSGTYVPGPLKDYTLLDDLNKITVPTLLMNGWKDQVTDKCVYPLFQQIPRVRWIQFPESSHMAQLEEHERFLQVVGLFLTEEGMGR
ncbi:hypothetical protein AGABI1DRAFT_47398 [Agaricus bisporus var. burnettii JB137-S8]|uniref:AB hydrolase-1 domain-containing protein n=1 Tax=Agaricus bisporus var. burnettii (strain JB137-S8 / ATCC MYA-4627 / FGSC 10392) TaxID=597362 RepID=K5WW40_AGABU|nr:uncharacterized protein AGABI1DRAFT_47398 [Agaricus bisporus var. burnettii JB137-S8]EKM74782.1 hypothetical protein AGABI1DRAFT_47398 [Agaricus bisporus var. burnettii JB137-S8]